MALSDEDIREILRIIDESDLSELRIDTDGFSLHVVKGERRLAAPAPSAPAPTTDRESASQREAATPAQATTPKTPAATPDAPAAAPDAPATSAETNGVTINAPMLGTFYRAEAPGQPPFVEIGKEVQPDTIVCIIEVMKMMNSVPAGVAGTIVEVNAENAELVEYGQPLFRVQPA